MDNSFKDMVDRSSDDKKALETHEEWLEINPHKLDEEDVKRRLEYVRTLICKLLK